MNRSPSLLRGYKFLVNLSYETADRRGFLYQITPATLVAVCAESYVSYARRLKNSPLDCFCLRNALTLIPWHSLFEPAYHLFSCT